MTEAHNNTNRYDPLAILLHWITFILVAAQFAVAWTMPEIERDTRPDRLISLHLSLGIVIAIVVLIRLGWRSVNRAPPPSPTTPAWQVLAAAVTHGLLYALLLALPLMGWANASSRGWEIHPFGLTALPNLVDKGSPIGHFMGEAHGAGSNLLLILIGIHLVAALYHHVVQRDDTLKRMLLGK